MSDTPIDATWWLASDGRWYPPTSHPGYPPTAPGPTVIGVAGAGPAEIIDRAVKRQLGEQATSAELMKLPHTYHVIHGLKKGPSDSDSDIDHLVIGPTGVWVIDSKNDAGTLTAAKGTLWNGRYSIDKKVAAVESQAKYARDVLGCDSNPVLCFVQATLPRPAQMVGRVRVLQLSSLSEHITAGQTTMLPAQINAAVERVGDWRRRPPAVKSGSAGGPPPTRPRVSSSPPPPSPPGNNRMGRLVVGLLAIVVTLVVIALAALFALGVFVRSAREIATSSTATTTTLVGPGWLTVSIDCPAPNGGHRLKPRVVGGTPGKVRVSATVNGAPQYLGEFGPYMPVPPIMGIAPNTTVGFDIQLVDDVGQAAPGYHIDITTPPTPC